jgi:hypothetical protein
MIIRQSAVTSNLLYSFRRLLLSTASCTIMMTQTIFMTQAGIDILTWFRYGKSSLFGVGKRWGPCDKDVTIVSHRPNLPKPPPQKWAVPTTMFYNLFFNASMSQAWLNVGLFSSTLGCFLKWPFCVDAKKIMHRVLHTKRFT